MSYLNTKEVSMLLGVTARTIAKRVETGKLKPLNPQHSTGYIFSKKYIEQIASNKKEVSNG
jgi:predicted site-specific integrase-resolvase